MAREKDCVAELVSRLQYSNFHVNKLQEMRDVATGAVSIELRVEVIQGSKDDDE